MKLLKFGVNFCLACALIVSTLLIIPLLPLPGQWYQLAIVQSGSMEPNLPVGSIAIYRQTNDYHPGEVIAYERDKNLVLHRIEDSLEQSAETTIYLTHGDANDSTLIEPVYARQVKGELVGHIPQLGYLFSWLRSQTGLAVLLFLPLALILISELIRLP